MSELVTEKMEGAEQIVEKMDEDAEQIVYSPEIISEIMPEKRRYRGQRGCDKTPRRINQNSIMNLKPYRNETLVEEDMSNKLPDKTIIICGVVLLVVIVCVTLWKKNKLYAEN